MSKGTRLWWALGSLGVATSVVENAYTAHTKMNLNEKDKIALDNAVHIQMLNGLGLCLLGMRKTRLHVIPGTFLLTGSILFPGIIFYSRIYDDRRFMKLVMVGGTCSVFGWLAMVIC